MTTVEDTLGWADIYVTTTGNCNIIRIEHMEVEEIPVIREREFRETWDS